jgi:PAS domain S-box-containing protein
MSSKPSILIVDDQIDNQKFLVNFLKPDYRVLVASDGAAALDLLSSAPPPDLILLDIMMPVMDGYETCRRIKDRPQLAQTPIIFLTAKTDPDSETRGFELGAADYVSKPINPPVLRARIEAQLALAEQMRRAYAERDRSHRLVAQVSRERNEIEALARRLEAEIAERERTEVALRESQARFERLTNKLKDKIVYFSHTLDGTMLYLSEGTESFGIGPPEQSIGRHWSEILPWLEDSLERAQEMDRQLISGALSVGEQEMSCLQPDGRQRHLLIRAYRIYDQERRLDLIEGLALDVTEQKARETQLRTLSQAVEQAPLSIVITDAKGAIVYVNPHFSHITGYSREEAIGQNPRLLKSGEQDEATYRALWETIASGRIWRGELINKNKQGQLFWESVAISPILDERGEVTHYVAVKEDIGDRKALERIKEDVQHIMRHDLKAPLNAVIALPGLILTDETLSEKTRKYLGMILDSGRQMYDMIELSLDLFKMETGHYEYMAQFIDVLPILRRLIRFTESRLSDKRLEVAIRLDGTVCPEGAELWVCADDRLLFSLLSNLFLNAIEASPDGETIRIELRRAETVVLALSNRGTVPETIRAHFFEKYRTQGKRGGTGLGTYSAKLMADTMGLELDMETSDDRDSTCLRLTLPVHC